jgi:hypothetical protein
MRILNIILNLTKQYARAQALDKLKENKMQQYITQARYIAKDGGYKIAPVDYSPYLEKDISEQAAIEQALEIFERLQDDFISW